MKEGTRQSGERLRVSIPTRSRIAGRKDDPVRRQIQLRNLGCRQQAIILLARLRRGRQDQRRLGEASEVAGDEAVSCKVQDAVLRQLTCCADLLQATLRRTLAQPHVAICSPELTGDGAQLISGFGQRHLAPQLAYVRQAATKQRSDKRQRLHHGGDLLTEARRVLVPAALSAPGSAIL